MCTKANEHVLETNFQVQGSLRHHHIHVTYSMSDQQSLKKYQNRKTAGRRSIYLLKGVQQQPELPTLEYRTKSISLSYISGKLLSNCESVFAMV